MEKLKNILILDDDPVNNFISATLLKKMDIAHDVCIFQSAIDALNFLSKGCFKDNNCPELMLVDINMPIMDGFEFIRKCKMYNVGMTGKVLFAMVTTSNNPKDVAEMKELGVEHILSKPLTQEKIQSILEKYATL